MPRIRTLKPEHRQHRKVGALDHITYRLWVGMILEADDEGRLVYDPEALRVLIFGYHVKVSRAIVERSTNVLAAAGLVTIYRVDGQEYACFPSWHDHQRIDRKKPSLLPVCDASSIDRRSIDDSSRKCRRDLDLDLDLDLEGKGSRSDQDAAPPDATPLTPPTNGPVRFNIPESIIRALERAPRLGAVPALRDPAWWQAVIRARPGVDMAMEVLKAEAWMTAHPEKRYRKLGAFLHGWIGRAERPEEDP